MKINLKSNYKSLNAFQSEELPKFTVIIGKNGSGKSQLVQLFNLLSKAKTKQELSKAALSVTPEISRLYSDTMEIERINFGNPSEYRNQFITIYQKYMECITNDTIRKAWHNFFTKRIGVAEIENFKIDSIEDMFAFKDFATNGTSVFVDSDLEYLDVVKTKRTWEKDSMALYNLFLKELKGCLDVFGATLYVAEYHKKDILNLGENDFLNSNLPEKYLDKSDLIDSKIENIFYYYLRKRQKNDFSYYKKTKYNEDNPSISPEEFNKLYSNPIVEINNVLDSLNLPYYFKEISEKDFSPESNTSFDFFKKTNDVKIQFSDLSSGEKIILGLIIRLFTSNFYKEDLKFPELIILDEPDAHLHPEMSNILIKVLNETFVNRIGIKVIMTTHSPMSVALAPEESIFQLNNHPETFLKKISKDDALKNLTYGLPNLTIDYENHRQVFVESPTDLFYFQTLFEKYSVQKTIKHKLYFISNGYGKGNCDQVLKVVKDLKNGGNKTCFGIIDWDKKNPHSKDVFVHGFQKRYSIENFVFDPLYLAILLIEQNYNELKNEIGYSDSDNQYDLIKTEKAQKAINFIISKLTPRNSQRISFESALQKHKYGNYSFEIPTWYLNLQGHELKQQILDQFKPLEGIKNSGEHEIEKRLTKIIGKMYPNVPIDTMELFEKLSA